ncbi:hypothetical protein ANCCAN_15688, partial [Ancylostoma caninum]
PLLRAISQTLTFSRLQTDSFHVISARPRHSSSQLPYVFLFREMRRAVLLCRQHIGSVRLCSGITKAAPSQVTQENAQFDEVTHTGQAWDQADYRLQRFDISKKQVNPNVAMHLIAQRPPKDCGNERVVFCDGGHPALGHPRVFINLW